MKFQNTKFKLLIPLFVLLFSTAKSQDQGVQLVLFDKYSTDTMVYTGTYTTYVPRKQDGTHDFFGTVYEIYMDNVILFTIMTNRENSGICFQVYEGQFSQNQNNQFIQICVPDEKFALVKAGSRYYKHHDEKSNVSLLYDYVQEMYVLLRIPVPMQMKPGYENYKAYLRFEVGKY